MESSQCLLEGCHSGPAQRLEGFVQNGCVLPLKQTKVGHLGQGGARGRWLEERDSLWHISQMDRSTNTNCYNTLNIHCTISINRASVYSCLTAEMQWNIVI